MATSNNGPLGLRLVFLLLGTLFGYILIRAGVSSYDVIREMFLLQSFHMYGVLGVAVPVSFICVQLWKKWGRKPLLAEETDWSVEKLSRKHVIGGLISGAGWALTGACPGPALAILGYGLMSGVFIVTGIFAGTWFFAWLEERKG
ncbi:MAG TPA: YeeE/YedE thiosulfate transporter family protein [Turneriella sp.]|nr:YeeE/YedE thiosulfate transporter family protein [Turneriella sp.]HNE18113.1 YeeE/YedE thiosulfate transporter family protein [Turneriella sp.]HNJ67175.1 YeeE/YedE thiosulfate transporter family protein [Turneriella sp.]HNL09921.1 YeeE/YedE thiosulfate transporter family protein [Turneriella sp.]HNN00335.1 YeeE/YedE thiosulfate transporter family protein [Turneriella sp.]